MLRSKSLILLLFIVPIWIGTMIFFNNQEQNNEKTPLISVIMSTYGRSSSDNNLLSNSIESILNQTETDFEFIIINDGSSDDTDNVLNYFSKKDPRIKILKNSTNKGLPYSLNKGLEIAKGKYIARMDDDDWSYPSRFQKQVAFLEKNKDIIATGCSFKKDFILPSDPEIAKILAFWEVPVIHPCAMIRRSFLEQNNIRYSNSFPNAEDMPFWFDITIKHNGLISNLSEILLHKKNDSSKKKDYLKIQNKSVNQYRQYACNYFNKSKKTYTKRIDCYMDLLKNKEAQKHINIDALNKYISDYVPPKNSIYVIHTLWRDHLILNKNHVKRFHGKDTAKIIEKNDLFIKVKWDKYGIETFEKKGNNYYLK
ncbi:MAG: glycosyltransferase family 2 protein [Alphaproteobacteria bacterium]|nr:glycosyltransferase family 2 protein [Alphaproteobacteria bacterium]